MEVSFAMMNLKLYLKTLTFEYAQNQPRVHGAMVFSLKNINRFSPNKLVFSKNLNFPSAGTDSLPALKNRTTSKIAV